jgi:hypothetical protein
VGRLVHAAPSLPGLLGAFWRWSFPSGAGGVMATEWSDGVAAGRRWVRALRRSTGEELATVVCRPGQTELIVVHPATGLLRVSPHQAVAVAACLTVALHGGDASVKRVT